MKRIIGHILFWPSFAVLICSILVRFQTSNIRTEHLVINYPFITHIAQKIPTELFHHPLTSYKDIPTFIYAAVCFVLGGILAFK